MEETTARPATLGRREADRRSQYRIPMRQLGGAATLRIEAQPEQAILGRLVNVSAGGCCLIAARRTTRDLMPGDDCVVTLPVTKQGLPFPATLVDLEAEFDDAHDADDVLLRLRFRKADSVTQQRLTHWLADLSIHSWHARTNRP